ncbi:MAG: ATP-binding cassette subfamily B protein, partial [Candidatus Saccharimonadales bacterium]
MKEIIRILKVGRELRSSYIAVSLITVLVSLMTILLPLLSGWGIDEIQKGSDANITYAAMLAVGIFVLDLMQTFFSNWGGYIGDQIAVKLNKILSERYYAHLMDLPQKYFDKELSGKIIARLNRSIVQITGFVHMMTNNFLQFIFSTIFSLAIVFTISWEIGLMLSSLYPIFIWMTVRSSSTWQDYQTKKNKNFDIANGRFAEAIGQVKVVKSYGQEKRELGYFSSHLNKVLKLNKPQSIFWHKQDVKRRLVLNVIFLGVYMFIFVRGAQGAFTAGQAVALILYAMNIRIPIFTISFLVENTQKAISDSRDYFEVMEEVKETDEAQNELKVDKGRIAFDEVSFGYEKGKDIIKKVSFDIKPGQKVALVGESGEGKTTLTNLLMRLYTTNSGSISIDKQQLSSVTRKSLRENISVVFQEPNLFSGTIRENIAYSEPNVSDAKVKVAAKAANAHDFIINLENGYDSEIGERGLKLSGGQKQRIAIARAIQKDAPILILDEATSSLDSRSELLVQEALERLMKNRTTIIIAHRLSTIQNVDMIVAIKGG